MTGDITAVSLVKQKVTLAFAFQRISENIRGVTLVK